MRRITITDKWFKRLTAPAVYIHRRGDTILYIGRGEGLKRPLAHIPAKWKGGDTLEVIFCDSKEESLSLERQLILQHRPINNKLLITSNSGRSAFDRAFMESLLDDS